MKTLLSHGHGCNSIHSKTMPRLSFLWVFLSGICCSEYPNKPILIPFICRHNMDMRKQIFILNKTMLLTSGLKSSNNSMACRSHTEVEATLKNPWHASCTLK